MSKRNRTRKRLRYHWIRFRSQRPKPSNRIGAFYSDAYLRAMKKLICRDPLRFKNAILEFFNSQRADEGQIGVTHFGSGDLYHDVAYRQQKPRRRMPARVNPKR